VTTRLGGVIKSHLIPSHLTNFQSRLKYF